MNQIFILTIIFVFLTILIESIDLILQLKGKKLTKWFGRNAFKIHAIVMLAFWVMTIILVFALQFEKHLLFHNNIILKYAGLVLFIGGLVLSTWALKLLGLRRALCLNFFEKKVPVVKSSLYKHFENPLDYGFVIFMFGLALLTASWYNLIIAIEALIIIIPHVKLENIPIERKSFK